MLDHRDRRLADRLAECVPEGLDVIWETSGHHDFDLVAGAASPGARVLVTAASAPASEVPWPRLYTRDVQVLGFVISRASVADLAAAAHALGDLASRGLLTTRITEVLPLDRTAAVHRRMEAGEVSGRILLRPGRG